METKLRNNKDYYEKEARDWATRLLDARINNLDRATPENVAKHQTVLEIMVEAYYNQEVDADKLVEIIDDEIRFTGTDDNPSSYVRYTRITGTNREALIKRVESFKFKGSSGYYKDGSNIFILNAMDENFNPIEDKFVPMILRDDKSE
ncbi:hypothetical protein K0B04_01765 [Patescibacteria group bacterium]|nr:hypothetical protein [Patescibacteria group bacterium]